MLSALNAFHLNFNHSEGRRTLAVFSSWPCFGCFMAFFCGVTRFRAQPDAPTALPSHCGGTCQVFVACDYGGLCRPDSSCFRCAIVRKTVPRPRRLATKLIESQFSKWRAVGMFNSGGLAGEAFIFHHVFYRQCSYHGNW